MSNIAYIRVSSTDQNNERQLADCGITFDRIFEDECSGKDTNRPALKAMLEYVRDGDCIHVHDISRLARNLEDLLNLVKDLNANGISVRFHKENLHFTGEANPMQELMLSMLGAVYQFERSMLRERQLEGIAIAQAAGKYKGRSPDYTRNKNIKKLRAEGVSLRKIAKQLGCSLSTVQRTLEK
ncbi:recombinase family protein [Planctobacterium marinum]|uniref:recombinase family protein n=1 Tax=Planctobacterium marinum TaxID=1631968 RepID=UPI001E3CE735|nr:recombinase family protein [Planctobacterium marinum]MCC2605152.1 recombinase family protein [Planctobacterium marinum]